MRKQDGEQGQGKRQSGSKSSWMDKEHAKRAHEFLGRSRSIIRVGGGELRARGKAGACRHQKEQYRDDQTAPRGARRRLRVSVGNPLRLQPLEVRGSAGKDVAERRRPAHEYPGSTEFITNQYSTTRRGCQFAAPLRASKKESRHRGDGGAVVLRGGTKRGTEFGHAGQSRSCMDVSPPSSAPARARVRPEENYLFAVCVSSMPCNSLPGLKRTAFPGGILTSSPVRGLRPMPVLRGRTLKTPKRRSSMRCPRPMAFLSDSKMVSTACSAFVRLILALATTAFTMSSLITPASQLVVG